MPILEPSLQSLLLNSLTNENSKHPNRFYFRYLRVASHNIYHDFTTVEASIQFRKDLQESIDLIHHIFGVQLLQSDIDDPNITDHYKFLYNKINPDIDLSNKKSKRLIGKYYKLNNPFSTQLFQPSLHLSEHHSWFFLDTPVAVLTIDLQNIEVDQQIFYQLIKLEIDLMVAAGFTLVLCANFKENCQDFFFEMIQRNQFSEIHLNFTSDHIRPLIIESDQIGHSYFKSFKGYFYCYTQYSNQMKDCIDKVNKFKEIPHVKTITFATTISDSLTSYEFINTDPFAYCKNGFDKRYLRIFLLNVPLYDNDDDSQSFVPSQISEHSICYIKPSDFLNWKEKRVEIIFDDMINNRRYKKYINFEDVHAIKKDFYAKDPLSTQNIPHKTIGKINEIEARIYEMNEKQKNKENFTKSFFFSFIKDKMIQNSLEYAICAYTFIQNSSGNQFLIHRPQIYTILEACKILLNKNSTKNLNQLISRRNKINSILSFDMESFSESKKFVFDEQYGKFKEIQDTIHKTKHFSPQVKEFLSIYLFNKPGNYLSKITNSNIDNLIKEIVLNKTGEEKKKLLDEKKEIEEQIIQYQRKNSKGVIYQVETGEGKSCIVSIIAAALALNGKTVHIATSNTHLANRDYRNSFKFFRLLNLKSAVFLNQSDLPVQVEKQDESKINENVANKKNESEIDPFFKENTTEFDDYYKDKKFDYYNFEQFQNSLKKNFAVCGLDNENKVPRNRPNIVFSTFVNFECFYLKMMELSPGMIDKYYDNCSLLIDEADSILIDEIGNGTIVSREVKSNLKEILKFVYEQHKNNIDPKDTFKSIKEKWPNCIDLTINNVKKMYSEIDLVKRSEFSNGKKYSIEKFEVKNEQKKKKLIKESLNLVKKTSVEIGKGLVKEFTKKGDEDDEEDEDDDDEDDEEEEEEDSEDNNKVTVFKHIVPYDYDHKGILEPSKEFGGFIQQFIALKESENKDNENMIIKNMSMSYLYVSHPIFVKLYGKVCGFTGTIGIDKDKRVYKQIYNLDIIKVPRNEANRRVDFPMILCKDINERNRKIVFEIIEFHKRGNPVLAIFQDLKEIDEIANMLNMKGIKYINIFDGKNTSIQPDKIAAYNGAVSLGSNVCGRGTNIKAKDKPLHVIISYFTSNSRVMDQALGRTARQGRKGTTHVICLKDQFLSPLHVSENGMDFVVEEFLIKNQVQTEFIQFFQDSRSWIFYTKMQNQALIDEQIQILKSARINVNRIVAFNFEFPLKMSVDTFLTIQAQRIFSILNCPNSKFTWKLFQKYVREMIFESWSIMINDFDEEFFERKENKKCKKKLNKLENLNLKEDSKKYIKKRNKINNKFKKIIEQYKKELYKNKDILLCKLLEYLPIEKNENGVVPTFVHIFKKVKEKYENDILNSFNSMSNVYYQIDKSSFFSIQLGFKPYSLLTKSGARISYKNFKKTNFITDPELKYLKRTPKNTLTLLSITEKIDDIFNSIFQAINGFLGNKTFLKLFMRRTLCGCEFGICLDFPMVNEKINDPNCIIDKDPLLLFTIGVRSMIPILAGILIIFLVYAASICKKIADFFLNYPKISEEILSKGIGIIVNIVSPELVNFALDKLIKFLKKVLNEQLAKLAKINESFASIIKSILSIFNSTIGEEINKKLSKFLGDKIKVTLNWQRFVNRLFDKKKVMKISFLLLLCLATFLLNFKSRKHAIKKAKEDSKEYEEAFKTKNRKKYEEKNEDIIKKKIDDLSAKNKNVGEIDDLSADNKKGGKIDDPDDSDDELDTKKLPKEEIERKNQQMKEQSEERVDSYFYKYKTYNPLQNFVKLSEIIEEKDDDISNGVQIVKCFIKKGFTKTSCTKFIYQGLREAFIQQIRIYGTNKFPSILNIIGCNIHKKKQLLFVETKEKGSLETIINSHKKIEDTHKLIIAYGVAPALEFLHKNKIVHRNLNPSNIMIDSHFHPYLSGFYYAKQIQDKHHYKVKETTPEFMAPEFFKDYKTNQESFEIDVYSLGVTLFILVSESNPFASKNPSDIFAETLSGKRPEFPSSFPQKWRELIERCWAHEPQQRPLMNDICKILESDTFNGESIDSIEFGKYKKQFSSY